MLGIVAGTGTLISNLIKDCDRQQRPYIIIAFDGQTDPELIQDRPHAWTKLGQVKHTLELLNEYKVTEIVMAGHFKRPSWSELKPDLKGMAWMSKIVGHTLGDDGLLKRMIRLIEAEGFKVISPENILGESLFIADGALTPLQPDAQALADIKQGCTILNHLAAMDVGQAIVIQQELILGIEAIEGTQELIQRCGQYKRPGPKPTLIKLCKPHQETRVDRPTVGLSTMKALAEHGYGGMALQAHGVIVLDQPQISAMANEYGMFIYGVKV